MKSKTVKTRKIHKCWKCSKNIPKGSIVRFIKILPSESIVMGMIDVSTPYSMYLCGGC